MIRAKEKADRLFHFSNFQVVSSRTFMVDAKRASFFRVRRFLRLAIAVLTLSCRDLAAASISARGRSFTEKLFDKALPSESTTSKLFLPVLSMLRQSPTVPFGP